MPARHRSRQRALQILYQWDMTRKPIEDAISQFYDTLYSEENDQRPARDEFMEELVKGACAETPEIDLRITGKSANWRIERMPTVDRNILRLPSYGMSEGISPAVGRDGGS